MTLQVFRKGFLTPTLLGALRTQKGANLRPFTLFGHNLVAVHFLTFFLGFMFRMYCIVKQTLPTRMKKNSGKIIYYVMPLNYPLKQFFFQKLLSNKH